MPCGQGVLVAGRGVLVGGGLALGDGVIVGDRVIVGEAVAVADGCGVIVTVGVIDGVLVGPEGVTVGSSVVIRRTPPALSACVVRAWKPATTSKKALTSAAPTIINRVIDCVEGCRIGPVVPLTKTPHQYRSWASECQFLGRALVYVGAGLAPPGRGILMVSNQITRITGLTPSPLSSRASEGRRGMPGRSPSPF
jgi:hypothetical protein